MRLRRAVAAVTLRTNWLKQASRRLPRLPRALVGSQVAALAVHNGVRGGDAPMRRHAQVDGRVPQVQCHDVQRISIGNPAKSTWNSPMLPRVVFSPKKRQNHISRSWIFCSQKLTSFEPDFFFGGEPGFFLLNGRRPRPGRRQKVTQTGKRHTAKNGAHANPQAPHERHGDRGVRP